MNDLQFRYRWLLLIATYLVMTACTSTPPTFHRAYEQAMKFGKEPRRGVVLFLHGCDGLGGFQASPKAASWVQYYTNSGFVLVVPDSFADSRPAQSCNAPYPHKEKIYQIRAKQTAFAIEQLRSIYPSSKLIVSGHSEGGGVANLLTAPVDGIITTGYQCGYRDTGRTFIRFEVPLLAIVGTADPYITEALRYSRVSSAYELCGKVYSSANWRALIIPDMTHSVSPDQAQVREALDRFLDEITGSP